MMLFYQVATRLSLTTCEVVVGTTCNKSVEFNNLEQLVSKLGSSGNTFYKKQLVGTALAQNKDTQKVDSAKKSVTATTP